MTDTKHELSIAVEGNARVDGIMIAPAKKSPGVLLVHGWDTDQSHYRIRAEDIASLGCVCLTFDLRGHGRQASLRATVTRAQNLQDVLAAYDVLASVSGVDPESIGLVGTSYGGYLAAIVSSMRAVRWLALRVPAPYPDDNWDQPKQSLDRTALTNYRSQVLPPGSDRALAACLGFAGDALVVASGCDDIVLSTGIASFVRSFQNVRSLTYRTIEGADHALSDPRSQRSYDALLTAWMTEMVLGSRRPNP
ncbi:alpha/beta fold hydrolase [Variovorax sp. J22P271]|uniref:alpha/beta hydrolase family protein n=1 Tax=Variovorax davisae TaxID=3053515 RepID=UPI002577D9F6|nr:alpha/beta fold hydrolase [Variovorax sp. J22P271]MDM0032254.1 alpha/beta fold hydrolase [Variovorax sp. J22P271]